MRGILKSVICIDYTMHSTVIRAVCQVSCILIEPTVYTLLPGVRRGAWGSQRSWLTRSSNRTVIFLHGGPGGGTSAGNTGFFNPALYRIVLMDQRGGGKSRPLAEIRENTTQLLVADIETLREKLQIPKWSMVFGGSWGSTLSLAYAQTHPEAVGSLVLRGIFLGEEWEFNWTLKGHGSAVLFPDRWEDFIQFLPEEKRNDPPKAYHELLVSEDRATALTAAKNWNRWEMSISTLLLANNAFEKLEDEDWNLQHARIEAHYFLNGCFLRDEKRLLRKENIDKIAHIPSESLPFTFDRW